MPLTNTRIHFSELPAAVSCRPPVRTPLTVRHLPGLGHFIGLDHSDLFTATMSPDYRKGQIQQRSLEDDDVAGLCAIYPPNRTEKSDPFPRGGFSSSCEEEVETGCTVCTTRIGSAPQPSPSRHWLWPLAMAAIIRLRARSRRHASRHMT